MSNTKADTDLLPSRDEYEFIHEVSDDDFIEILEEVHAIFCLPRFPDSPYICDQIGDQMIKRFDHEDDVHLDVQNYFYKVCEMYDVLPDHAEAGFGWFGRSDQEARAHLLERLIKKIEA